MQYMLNVKENTVFGFSQGPMRSNGYIEYFDTANPFGLLKLNFVMMSTNPKELNLIPMLNSFDDFSKKLCNTAIDTFEEIEKKILEKGILPKTVIITGITFFFNPEMNIQEQMYHYYIYPNKPRNYCVRLPRGMTKNLFRGDNEERPRVPYQNKPQHVANENRNQQQRQQPNHPHKKSHKQKQKHPNQATPAVAKTDIPEEVLDTVINGNVGEFHAADLTEKPLLEPISDEVIRNASNNLDEAMQQVKDKITYSTDTGISDDFEQKDYDTAVAEDPNLVPDGPSETVAVANG